MTRLREAAYNAQLAAGLPTSDLARAVLIERDGRIHHRHCAAYLHAVQQLDWFRAAFAAHTRPVTVVGGGQPRRRGPARATPEVRIPGVGNTDAQ